MHESTILFVFLNIESPSNIRVNASGSHVLDCSSETNSPNRYLRKTRPSLSYKSLVPKAAVKAAENRDRPTKENKTTKYFQRYIKPAVNSPKKTYNN